MFDNLTVAALSASDEGEVILAVGEKGAFVKTVLPVAILKELSKWVTKWIAGDCCT